MMNNCKRIKKQSSQNGSALIVVLCVLALLMALSAALLVSTQSVVNSNSQYTDTIQCKLLNQSFGNSLINTISNTDAGSFGGKLVTLAISGADSKKFFLTDNTTGANHTVFVNFDKRSETDQNYEMFVTISTKYKNEQYSQTLRFTSSKYNSTFIWALARTDKTETGGNPS